MSAQSVDLSATKCLPEIWHVQITKGGAYVGFYQFFHPNPEAAREEAERLRVELPWAEVHVGRYVLAGVESAYDA